MSIIADIVRLKTGYANWSKFVLRLSSEIGSDARSTFTFFSGDVGGAESSYANFIKNADITVSGGKLNLYIAAGLFDFLRFILTYPARVNIMHVS